MEKYKGLLTVSTEELGEISSKILWIAKNFDSIYPNLQNLKKYYGNVFDNLQNLKNRSEESTTY